MSLVARIAEVGVVEHPAQARFDGDPDPRGREPAREVDEEPHQGEHEDRGEIRDQPTLLRPDDRLVDQTLDQDRDRDRERRVDERERQSGSDQAALFPPEGEESAQGRPEGKIRWIDVIHALLPLPRPARAATGARSRATRGKSLTIPAACSP